MKKINRDFKGVWIPKEVWENTNLSLQEKVFYVEIDSLDNEDGCFANNDYFAYFFKLSKKRVSLIIQSLIKKGLINSTVSAEDGNKRTLRTIPQNGDTLSHKTGIPSGTKEGDPIPQNGEHSNTVSNLVNTNPSDLVPTAPVEYGNHEINSLIVYLMKQQGLTSLDDSQKWNRIYARNLLKTFKGDLDKTKRFIDYAISDPFHQKNCTSFNYLYKNKSKIALTIKQKIENNPVYE